MASKSMEENKRWIVTYTKHIRQKRKVYQDGVLEHHCSSNKILLYDDSGKLLDSRFLKKDDLVECGVTLAFESHLVDICDLDETHMPIKDHKLHDSGEKSTEKAKMYGRISTNSSLGNKRIELPTNRKVQNRPNPIPAAMRGLEESKNNPSDKKVVISSGGSRFTKGEEVFVNKQLHRDAFQILSALRRPPQQSLVPGKPLVDAACPQYLGLSHSDLPGIGCALKSDTVPETPSDVPKLVNPDCEVELWMVNHSPSSSILYGEGPCKSPITNLGVDSTVKNFLHLGTSGIVSEASDAANGSGRRTCIKEPHGSHAEEKSMQGSGGGGLIFKWKYCADESIMVLVFHLFLFFLDYADASKIIPDYMGLNSNALQNKEHGNNETCSQV